ncbi:MAG: hypothetical protein ACOYK1_08920, partial [Vampirovibrionia bacterium]
MLNNSLANLNKDISKLDNQFMVGSSPAPQIDPDEIQEQANQILSRADALRQELGITQNGNYDVGDNLNDSVKHNHNTSNTSITTSSGNDVISNTLGVNNSSKVNSNSIRSGQGNDIIINNGSENFISAGQGDDVINNVSGNGNSISGGMGNDVIKNSNSTGVTIRGGTGDDIIISDTTGNNKIRGGAGNDTIIVNTSPAGTSTGLLDIRGGSGDDTVILSGHAEDYGLGVDAAGNKTYTHKASGSRINIKNDVEEIKFEQVNLLTDEPAPNQTFEQGFEDYNNTHNQLTELISSGNMAGADRLQEQLDIKGDNLLDNTESITMSYDDFVNPKEASPVVRAAQLGFFQELNSDVTQDLENQLTVALSLDTAAGRISAAAIRQELATTDKLTEVNGDSLDVMNQLIDKTQIDFGGINQDQAKFFYGLNLDIVTNLENQTSEALAAIGTDAGRISFAALNTEMKITKHVVSELERQFGFNKEDVFPERYEQSKFFIDLNNNILSDLEGQMAEALSIDTEAGRISAAGLRTEISTTKSSLKFWTETANFWKPN